MSKIVVLDMGHGGRDSGAVGKNTYEKNNNLTLGLKIGKILQRHNITVHYTRTSDKDFGNSYFDVNADLVNRIAIAKQYKPNVFISLHNNSGGGRGIETFCYKFGGSDERLARFIQNSMIKELNMVNRGAKTANHYVTRKFDGTNTSACLVEYGFIDTEENLILSNMDKASIAISKGILEFLGIKYIGDDKMLKKAVLLYSKDDYFVGGDVALKYNCAIFIRPADKSCPKEAFSAEQLFVVGGSTVKHPNEILLSGKNKYDTATAVGKFLS